MRTIKFRAWQYGNMVYNISFADYLEEDDVQIMQFTGLLDKNSKEIYEGDILYIHLYGKQSDVYQLEDGRWLLRGYGAVYSWEAQEIEVIGNIHENPELLEGK